MKHIAKIASLVLAIAMLFALALPVFAVETGTEDPLAVPDAEATVERGSITVENAPANQTYSIYRILYLESYESIEVNGVEAGHYSYKATAKWKPFVESTEAAYYLGTDDQGYVSWHAPTEKTQVAAFAKLAKKWAEDNNIEPDGSQTPQTTGTIKFEDLDLGWYLGESTLGTLCALDTTNPDFVLEAKNIVPTIEKLVEEDSSKSLQPENTAEIGQVVNFRTVVRAQAGALSYIVHDTMDPGLTFDKLDRIATGSAEDETLVDPANYTLVENPGDGCTFHIVFEQKFLDTFTVPTTIGIFYSAILNEDAVVYPTPNVNETKLSYGEGSRTETVPVTTDTYTFEFDLVKTTDKNDLLDGAEFELYLDAECTEAKRLQLVHEGNGVYRLASSPEQAQTTVTLAVDNGLVKVKGLDANTTYYLKETKTPAGYNKLSDNKAVSIVTSNLSATVENGKWVSGGVHIINSTGTELPSTGGMGTTLFYIVGAVLMLGAVVMLVAKKRTDAEE